jgi:hypothetical protein
MGTMFLIDSQDELKLFINQNDMKDKCQWEIRGDRVFFKSEKENAREIPATRMITHSIDYATEMNRII